MTLPEIAEKFPNPFRATLTISDENHLPLDLHLQRLQLPNNDGNVVFLMDGEKIVGLNMAGLELRDEDLGFLKDDFFSNLKSLNLCGNNLKRWYLPRNLSSLIYLEISDNEQLELLEFSHGIKSLKRMDLSNCALRELNLPGDFTSLTFLDASYNKQLKVLHLSVDFPALKYLYLADCSLYELHFDKELSELRYLFANKNQLEVEGFNKNKLTFPKLETLELTQNGFRQIDIEFMRRIPRILNLGLGENPLPESILSNINKSPREDLAFLKRYTQVLDKDGIEDTEVKILLLGNGNVGKSVFLGRLVYNTFNKKWESTHGIVIKENYKGKESDETLNLVSPYTYNIWDFAGQDIYHATHRLFMQANALYLILWDKETEASSCTEIEEAGKIRTYENYPLGYWLHYAQKIGNNSPTIVIQTKVKRDQPIDRPDIRKIYKAPFLVDFHHIESSLEDVYKNGYYELLTSMRKAVKQMKDKEEIPTLWHEVREQVRVQKDQGQKWLKLEEFDELCKGYEEPLEILRWLTQSGVVFYQEKLFKGVILDQDWAIDAIYALFDRSKHFHKIIESGDGILRGAYLEEEVWEKYNDDERDLFISFLLSCEMCFEISIETDAIFRERRFVAPQLLPLKDQKNHEDFWDGKSSVYMRYEHDHFHYGIIQSLIVRMHFLSSNTSLQESRDIWKLGIRLRAKRGKATHWAEIDAQERLIEVRTTPGAQMLIRKIREELYAIREEEGLMLVSMDGETFVDIKKLESAYKNKRTLVMDTEGEEHEVSEFFPFLKEEGHLEYISLEHEETAPKDLENLTIQIRELVGKGDLGMIFNKMDEIPPTTLQDTTGDAYIKLKSRFYRYMDAIDEYTRSEKDEKEEYFIDKTLLLIHELVKPETQSGTRFNDEQDIYLSGIGAGKSGRDKIGIDSKPYAKVYFTYAYGKDGDEGESREELIEKLYKKVNREAIEVIREKTHLQQGQSVSKFTQEIGTGDLIIVFISEMYLKSINRMHELIGVSKNNKFKKEEFVDRIMPIYVHDINLHSEEVCDTYVTYWKEKEAEIDGYIKKWKTEGNTTSEASKRYDTVHEIRTSFLEIAAWLRDIHTYTIELDSDKDFQRVIDAIKVKLKEKS